MTQTLPILAGKTISLLSRAIGRSGSTWPGHMALNLDSNFVKSAIKANPKLRIILVAGTNGKTTTSKIICEALKSQGLKVFGNQEGANLLNGVASSLLSNSNLLGKISYDVAVFETDENSLPIIAENTKPFAIVLLNLFRDQLDRYGEVNTIAEKWQKTLKLLPKNAILISNGDDPMLSFMGEDSGLNVFYFGLPQKIDSNKEIGSDLDFSHCPKCSTKLNYQNRTYSHLGKFSCPRCNFKNPMTYSFKSLSSPMLGEYNTYNIYAASILLTEGFGLGLETIENVLKNFSPAFGRQEKIIYKNKNIFLMLSKNPSSFNQSIKAILSKNKKPNMLFVLNDRIPDGTDISWIWDIDTEELIRKANSITVSGDRCYDMGLRIKYSSEFSISNSQFSINFRIEENLKQAIAIGISKLKNNETLYILPTYSAMLEVRKIITGRKIL